jgi:hypothetical protein
MTYFEKHRGDETPFTRVSATDLTEDQAAQAISDLPSEAVVPVATDVSTIAKPEESLQARSVTTNLKVYSTDVEIGALYIMHDQELLVTFKLVNPLSRLDRCTGVNYKWLHRKFSWILEARRRFKRCQRLHTSDGDKAQDLAERILSHENAGKENCPVPTLRNRCQVHRVYHCITHGMLQAEAFISGQVKLALSLRGPGHFTKFKELLWTWLLAHYVYNFEANPTGPGVPADTHRDNIYATYFPTVRGKHQRRNRLKFWIVYRLPNGDIRRRNRFEHWCKDGCCKSLKDFLRKLKWFVAVVAGKLCLIFPRSRWTRMDEAVDWVGVMSEIHGILPTVYRLWYHKVSGRNPPPSADADLGAGPPDLLALHDEDPFDAGADIAEDADADPNAADAPNPDNDAAPANADGQPVESAMEKG